MKPALPEDSEIEISHHNGYELLTVPHSSGGIARYFVGLFLLFWLGGWFTGFTSALDQITSGKADAFIIFWLGGWTIGGLFAFFFLYRIFKKTVPEMLLLNRPNLAYDTGIPPFQITFHPTNQKEYWKSLFAKRKKHEFTPEQMKTLKLRETDSGNRLTIDSGAKRHEIGNGVSEIEREWLYVHLSKNYS